MVAETKKICLECGREFCTQRSWQVYCHYLCKHRNSKMRERGWTSSKASKVPCVECGRIFLPKTRRNVSCSGRCRYIRSKKLAKNKKPKREAKSLLSAEEKIRRKKLSQKLYCQKNAEKIKAYRKNCKEKNPQKIKDATRRYINENRDIIRAKKALDYRKNFEARRLERLRWKRQKKIDRLVASIALLQSAFQGAMNGTDFAE